MDQKDKDILNLIRNSKLVLDNTDFELRCMQVVNEQIQLTRKPSAYYKISSRFYLAGTVVCFALICLSLIEIPDNIMNLIFLQSLAIGTFCCLILQIKQLFAYHR